MSKVAIDHTDASIILQKQNAAAAAVNVGSHYYHYKNPGDHYVIAAVGIIENTEEPCVVYRAEYGEKITWVRTLAEFTAEVLLPDGKVVKRFTLV